MKRGSTSTLKIKISGLTSEMIEDVQTIEWRFSKKGEREDNQSVYKKYPDDVDYDEETNMFYVPLTQENTLALSAGLIEYEAQINFKNKCVVKTNIVVDDSERTLGTTLISGNTPDGSIDGADIQLDVEGAVSYGKDGVTFTPHITSENNEVILSWTNDGDKENPEPINIKGDKGDQGVQGEKGDKGDSPVKGVDYWTSEDVASMESDIEDYINPLLNLKADKSTTYTKTETDSLLSAKANSSDVYDKDNIDMLLDKKANINEVYTINETYNKDEIDREMARKVDGNTVYTKTETDRLLEYKMNIGDAYTVAESNRLLDQKADESEMNLLLNTKADVISVYTKTETDTLLNAKANSSDVYTKTDVYNKTETYNNTEVYNKTEINNMLAGASYEEITPSNIVSDSANVFENDVLTTVTKEGYTRNVYFGKSYNETLYLSCIVSDMTVPVAIVASDIGADISDCVVIYASRTGTFNKSISFDMGDLSSGANIYINNAATTSATLYRKITNVDVYSKEETDNLLDLKADKSTTYTKTETDSLLNAKANSTDVYTKNETYNQNEIESMLNTKANAIEVYTKDETYDKDYIDRSLAYKADGNTVYTKTETDRLLEYKMNIGDAYTVAESNRLLAQKADESEMNLLLNTKADVISVYTKTETDNLLNAKANSSDVYTKTQTDTLLSAKANTSDVYTKTQADTLLANKVDVSDFENLEADVESVMLYVGYDKDVAGLCADFENDTFTRIAGSVGKSAGTDFDSWSCFGGRRRCNVADDGTINAWYGDNDFVEDGSNGQVMVYQPKFYYRVEPLKLEAQSTGIGYHLKKANYYVSDTQKAGFKLHPAFIDKNGSEIDYIMFSAYEGCLYDTSASAYITDDSQVMTTSEDKLSSIANVKPCSGNTQNLTRPIVETLAQNRGSNWHGETIKFASVNQLLCAIEYASFNFQTAIGQGVISYENGRGNEASNTGATSTLGNASGQATETTHVSSDNVTTIDTTAGKLSVSYRGVENIWGNIWKLEYGVNIWGDGTMNGGQPYICSDYNFAESKNSDNYVGAGFTVANTNGYIKYFGYSEDFDYLFIASEVGGTSSLPVGDYFYVTSNLNAYRIALLGGSWSSSSYAGGFYWYLNYGVGFRYRNVGCRLAYTPTR